MIDGIVIGASYLSSLSIGLASTIAICLHELPQEIGDFGVLIYAGFKKKKALIINYVVALTVVAGGIAGYFIAQSLHQVIPYLLPFAAGGFIYIAASDLMPEIIRQEKLKKSIITFMIFIVGISIMLAVKLI